MPYKDPGMGSENFGEIRIAAEIVLRSDRLRQALADLELFVAENRRLLALHEDEPNRSPIEREQR